MSTYFETFVEKNETMVYNKGEGRGVYNMTIGERIRRRREELELSQEELAQRLGYKSRSSINKIEREASGLPQPKIAAIAAALNTTPSYIMGWEEELKKNDALADIIIKLRTDERFMSAVVNLYNLDDEKMEKAEQIIQLL